MEPPQERYSEIIEVPIFPLPNVVFFPRTHLPLHIFEDRYRKMVAESLEGERRIGMVLLKSGWETESLNNPDVYSVGSLGVISDYQELEGGKYDIMLAGVSRFRILSFVSQSPYRIAKVGVIDESYNQQLEDRGLVGKLLENFKDLIGDGSSLEGDLEIFEDADFPTLVNGICAAAPLTVQDKQFLLEIDGVRARADAVLSLVKQLLAQKELIDGFIHLRPEDPAVN